MNRFAQILKFLLWLFVTVIFSADLIKIVLDLSLVSGSVHQRFLTVFFRSSFFFFELMMAGIIIYFMVRHPERRLRLLSLMTFHYTSVLILPLVFKDHTWMAVLYPWPQTLLAFDPKTTRLIASLSLLVGFVVIPLLTFVWGAKAFCGYVCPHGAFYSEAYGRLYSARAARMNRLKKYFPPVYFFAMAAALALILISPATLEPVRQIQKVVFFLTSQFFYLVIGVPAIGPRSYCTHFCPVGYEIKYLIKLKQKIAPMRPAVN